MSKKNKRDQSEPVMVIIDTLYDDDYEICDKKTFEEIEKHLEDLKRLRELDCLFMSETKNSAKAISNSLRRDHGYKTEKYYHDEDGWITHAVKQILYADLKDTLKTARETSAIHSSKLFDWMIEADK
jgi:hypothetical protein